MIIMRLVGELSVVARRSRRRRRASPPLLAPGPALRPALYYDYYIEIIII